jgi:hypothetical protein
MLAGHLNFAMMLKRIGQDSTIKKNGIWVVKPKGNSKIQNGGTIPYIAIYI